MLAGTLLPVAVMSLVDTKAERLSWMLLVLLVVTLVVTFVLKREEWAEKKAKDKKIAFVPKLDLYFCLFVLATFVIEIGVVAYAGWLNSGSVPQMMELMFMQSFSVLGGGLIATVIGSVLCLANVYMALLLNRRLLRLHKLDLGWRSVLKTVIVVVLVVVVATFAMIFADVDTRSDKYFYSIVLLGIICGLATIALDCLVRNRRSLLVVPYLVLSSFFLLLWSLPILAIFAAVGFVYAILWYKNHSYEKAKGVDDAPAKAVVEHKASAESKQEKEPEKKESEEPKNPGRKIVEGL